jgi:hypothetical protein
VTLSGKSGIFKLNLPQSKQLETGKKYNWEFSLDCGSGALSRRVSLAGNIERVELSPEVKTKLEKSATLIEKARIYASNYLWQETLTILAEQRDQYPKEWQELLTSVGLKDFAQAPFVN